MFTSLKGWERKMLRMQKFIVKEKQKKKSKKFKYTNMEGKNQNNNEAKLSCFNIKMLWYQK